MTGGSKQSKAGSSGQGSCIRTVYTGAGMWCKKTMLNVICAISTFNSNSFYGCTTSCASPKFHYSVTSPIIKNLSLPLSRRRLQTPINSIRRLLFDISWQEDGEIINRHWTATGGIRRAKGYGFFKGTSLLCNPGGPQTVSFIIRMLIITFTGTAIPRRVKENLLLSIKKAHSILSMPNSNQLLIKTYSFISKL